MNIDEVKVNATTNKNGEAIVHFIPHSEIKEHSKHNAQNYTLNSIDSIIKLVKSKGTEGTVIAYNETDVQVLLDDRVQGVAQDKAAYTFKLSLEAQDWLNHWLNLRKGSYSQKEVVDFFRRVDPGLKVEPSAESLISVFSAMKFITRIAGEYSKDDNGDTTFLFKSTAGEGSMTLPKHVCVDLALINGSDFEQTIEFEIEVSKPKSEDEKPRITFTCPRYKYYYKLAVEAEVEKLKTELNENIILEGSIF